MEREGCRESDPDRDPHIHPTVDLLSKQTGYMVSQYRQWRWEDLKQRGGAANVNTGFDRERESTTIHNLETKKREKKTKTQHFYLLSTGLLSRSFLSCQDFKINDLHHWHGPADAVGNVA